MEWLTLTKNNIDNEHICCALSSYQDKQVLSKKEWLKNQMDNGLVFTKGKIRGKCFIEYLPIEHAWISLIGNDLMYINCFWVSGQFQKRGYAKVLLKNCQQDCLQKGKKGLVILSSLKKKPYTMDYDFLVYHGFENVDTWNDYQLMFLSLADDSQKPQFAISKMKEDGLVLYYSDQCPFNTKYVALLKRYCLENQISMQFIHLDSREKAINAPTALTTYSLFYNKHFLTREVLTVRKFEKIWRDINE